MVLVCRSLFTPSGRTTPFPTNFGQSARNSVKVQPISTLRLPKPDRPPNCRTAEVACTFSEMHALSPKLAGKRCRLGRAGVWLTMLPVGNLDRTDGQTDGAAAAGGGRRGAGEMTPRVGSAPTPAPVPSGRAESEANWASSAEGRRQTPPPVSRPGPTPE